MCRYIVVVLFEIAFGPPDCSTSLKFLLIPHVVLGSKTYLQSLCVWKACQRACQRLQDRLQEINESLRALPGRIFVLGVVRSY
jgi:hypothetical protein